MGAWFDRKDPARTALRSLPFFLVVIFAISSSGVTALEGRRPHGDATDIFYGNREVSVDSISAPINSASEGANRALDPDDFGAADRPKPLPVWPPPPAVSAVDPAANAMIGAPPMRVDWPRPPPPHPRSHSGSSGHSSH